MEKDLGSGDGNHVTESHQHNSRKYWLTAIAVITCAIVFVIVTGGFEGIGKIRAAMEKDELLPRINRLYPDGDTAAISNEDAMAKRIERSTVIVFTEKRERDGGQADVIVEIFKLVKDVDFYYEVGDVLGDIDCGEHGPSASRAIHFFEGNPADSKSSMSIHSGYLLKQFDLPESEVREKIAEIIKEGRTVESMNPQESAMTDSLKEKIMNFNPTFDEQLENAKHIVFWETEIENGMVESYVKEVFELNSNFSSGVKVGDKGPDSRKMEKNTTYGEGMLQFFGEIANISNSGVAVHHGMITAFGGMKIDEALQKIRDEVDARGNDQEK